MPRLCQTPGFVRRWLNVTGDKRHGAPGGKDRHRTGQGKQGKLRPGRRRQKPTHGQITGLG